MVRTEATQPAFFSILEAAVFRQDGQTVGRSVLHAADHTGVDAERFRDLDHLLCLVGAEVDLHAVAHVEHLVHLGPVGARLLADELEQRRDGEHVVLDHMLVLHEVHHLGLGAAGAMHHAVDVGAHLFEYLLDYRGIGACGREHQLAGH